MTDRLRAMIVSPSRAGAVRGAAALASAEQALGDAAHRLFLLTDGTARPRGAPDDAASRTEPIAMAIDLLAGAGDASADAHRQLRAMTTRRPMLSLAAWWSRRFARAPVAATTLHRDKGAA